MRNLIKLDRIIKKANLILYTIIIPVIAALLFSKWLVISLLELGYPLAEIWHYVIIFSITVIFTYLANVSYFKLIKLWK